MKEEDRGLRAHSRRGRIGRTWWSLRWTTVLESIGLGDRLHRGRSLARAGNILSLEISPGKATAEVRGNHRELYAVNIRMEPIPADAWEALQEILARQALFAAKLLVGEMPEPIEEAFSEAGLRLFPASVEELAVECDCADPACPCPHAAAVFYLLAERFDQDPFLIFYFRGQSREDLLTGLKRRWAQNCTKETEATETIETIETGVPAEDACGNGVEVDHSGSRAANSEAASTLHGDWQDGFWDLGPELDAVIPRIQAPPIAEAVLRRLGPPPGAVTDSPADLALHKAYCLASEWALRLSVKEEGHET